MEEFEYYGVWWVPENSSKKVGGILTFNPKEGGFLKLVSSFKEIKDLLNFQELKIILGTTDNGKSITLYNCLEEHQNLVSPSLLSSDFSVGIIFEGCHFQRENDIVFNRIIISYSYLDIWLGISGINISYNQYEDSHQISRFEITYVNPKEIKTNVNDFSINFLFEGQFNFKVLDKNKFKECNLIHNSYIEIECKKDLYFKEYQDNVFYHLQNFFSLAIGEPVYPLHIKGKNSFFITEFKGKIIQKEILIFYALGRSFNIKKEIYSDDMLFTFSDISDSFGEYLSKWFLNANKLSSIYDLYFGTLYNPFSYLEHKFLNLIQGLESFHRRIHGGNYVSENNFSQIYKKLVQAISTDIEKNFYDSLIQRLKFLNEYSLRTRLKNLLNLCGGVIDVLIEDDKKFIYDIIDMRNLLTHHSQKLEEKVKKDEYLLFRVFQMRFLLEICFLKEIGISQEKIKEIFSRNKRYNQIKKAFNS